MAEYVSFKDRIKMEIDIDYDDEEDYFVVYNVLDAAEDILDQNEDPLLSLTPLVYTTKLDDMKTIKQDLTNLNANQILRKLHSESKPIIMTESIKNSSKSDNVESFARLASVISDVNCKATRQLPTNAVISPNEGIPQISANAVLPTNAIHQISSNAVIPPNKDNRQISLNAVILPEKTNRTFCLNAYLPSRSDNGSKTTEHSESEGSFSNISGVASDIIMKIEPEISTNAATAPNSDTAPIANTAADKEYIPCNVVLEDIKKFMPANLTTVKLPLRSNTTRKSAIVDPNGSIIYEVKVKLAEPVENQTTDVEIDVDVSGSSETQISRLQNTNTILKPVSDSNVPTYSQTHVLKNETKQSRKESQIQKTKTGEIPAENLDTKNKNAKTTSVRSKRKRKACIFHVASSDEDYEPDEDHEPYEEDDPDEDYKPIINLKKKTMTKKTIVSNSVAKTVPNKVPNSNNVSNISNVQQQTTIVVTNDSAPTAFQEKYTLIVLMYKKKKKFVYRVNATKLVTDYYITNDYDEYKFASMYPKEDKVIEQYCCWYKREEVIARICSRKNYPYTILKFLKLVHTCHPEECHCCCRISHGDNSQIKQKERRTQIYRSRKRLAEKRICELLNKTNTTATGLVSKALSYTPKVIKETLVEKQCEKYLGNYLLCIRNDIRIFNAPNSEYELYEIGQNGNVLRSLFLHNKEEVVSVRRTFLMSIPIRDAELCCWYKREKLMQELKMLKTSPATLKQIRKPHSCHQKCSCCCKPLTVKLLAVESLPSTFKQTTGYEKNPRRLTIQFSAKSKNTTLKEIENFRKSKETIKSTDASTAAVVLSRCASKDDNQDLSISILKKFKNIQLDINSRGELEAVLKEPAMNLSVGELKKLSDILTLSKKQIVELDLSAEEFCNRINSKSSDIIRVTAPETELIRNEEVAPPPLQDHYEDNGLMDIKVEYINAENDPITISKKQTMITGETAIKSPKLLRTTEPRKTALSLKKSLTPKSSKSTSSTFTLLSNFMEKKNNNFVDSFKSFFNQSEPSNLGLPNINQFTPVSVSAGGIEDTTTDVPLLFPVIKETFTLVTEMPTTAIPGPSGITQPRGTYKTDILSNQFQTMTNWPKTFKRKMENVTNTQVDKKIRVKLPSELNAPIIQASPIANSQLSAWPAPIVLKRDPQTNIQQMVKPIITTAKTISPNVQNHTYVLPASNLIASNLKIVSPIKVHKVFQINGNPVQVNPSNTGTRYLTLAPIKSNAVDGSKKTMLDKMLKAPHAPPAVTSSARCHVPPLVPIRSVGAAPTVMKEQRSSNETEDLENPITYYNLLQHKQ